MVGSLSGLPFCFRVNAMVDSLMNTYARFPVAFERGDGAWLWDTDGRRYLDALSGIAVCGLGHAHPAVTEALRNQAGTLVHTSNLYRIPAQEQLADALTALSGLDRVFFCNSGAEANEAAIKLCRFHGHRKGIDLPVIVAMEGGFHGRTLATLTATGSRKVQAGFEPLVQGFVRVPYNDLESLATVAAARNDLVAVMLEPLLGEGGIVVPDPGYLEGVREICDRHGLLLVLDEVQTGMGRTGKWFAHQHSALVPDVMSLAKSLGNGVPIGACLARGDAANVLVPGSHGSTFGGNPLACKVALAVIRTMREEDIPGRAARLGDYLQGRFCEQLASSELVRAVRGQGLMIGIELTRPCGDLVRQALDKGLLINVTAERVIRLLPPLIIDQAQADQIVATVSDLVREFRAAA